MDVHVVILRATVETDAPGASARQADEIVHEVLRRIDQRTREAGRRDDATFWDTAIDRRGGASSPDRAGWAR